MITCGHERKTFVEIPGFEPGASYMRSKRSTTELYPLLPGVARKGNIILESGFLS